MVIFSAAHPKQEEQLCLQLGATAYVQKPEAIEKFFTAIAEIMGEWLPEEEDSD